MFGALERFWSQADLAARYPELLFHIHCVVRATVPAMDAARRRAEAQSAYDPVAAGVAQYLSRHIPEELGHDDWLLEDMEALGISRQTVLRRVPSPAAAELVGSLYYWVLHAHPVAWMGYAAVTEGHPPSTDFLLGVIERTGLPRTGFRTYLKHAQIDPNHSHEMYATLDSMPLTADHISLLGVVAFRTIHNLAVLFDALTGSKLPHCNLR
jgi:hypothetical protein